MQFRESGMPERSLWETLLNVPLILDHFRFSTSTGDVAELGCGYGTFTIPLAQRIGGTVYAIDSNPIMVEATQHRAYAAGLRNAHVAVRDVIADGFGIPYHSCDAVMLFNILHCEQPIQVLDVARQTVSVGGMLSIIHWRSDIDTPRGPSAPIRPKSEDVLRWASTVGGLAVVEPPFLLPPWHYGIALRRVN